MRVSLEAQYHKAFKALSTAIEMQSPNFAKNIISISVRLELSLQGLALTKCMGRTSWLQLKAWMVVVQQTATLAFLENDCARQGVTINPAYFGNLG